MTAYTNAPGVTDAQVESALVRAADDADALKAEITAEPMKASASRLFAMIQARAENEVAALGIKDPAERDRAELVIIADVIGDIHGILVEEMTAILAAGK